MTPKKGGTETLIRCFTSKTDILSMKNDDFATSVPPTELALVIYAVLKLPLND